MIDKSKYKRHHKHTTTNLQHHRSMFRRFGGDHSRFGINFGEKLFGHRMFFVVIVLRRAGDLDVHGGHIRAVDIRMRLERTPAQDDLRRLAFVHRERGHLAVLLHDHRHRFAIHHLHRRHHVLHEYTHFHAVVNGDGLDLCGNLHRHHITHRDEEIAFEVGLVEHDEARLLLIVLHHPPSAQELRLRIAELLSPLFDRRLHRHLPLTVLAVLGLHRRSHLLHALRHRQTLIEITKYGTHSPSSTCLLFDSLFWFCFFLLLLVLFRSRGTRSSLLCISQCAPFGVPHQSRGLKVLLDIVGEGLLKGLHLLVPLLDLRRLIVFEDSI